VIAKLGIELAELERLRDTLNRVTAAARAALEA